MQSIYELVGSRKVVEECANVKPGEEVLILVDWNTAAQNIHERFAAAVKQRDANATVCIMEPRKYNGNEPSQTATVAMQNADVILASLDKIIAHSNATTEARESGTRYLILPNTAEEFRDGALYADFSEIQPNLEKTVEKFTDADEAYVTSPQGTDITFNLKGRDANAINAFATEPGSISAPGSIEANISPTEAEGTIVVDGCIPDLGIGALDENVRLTIRDNHITEIEGGAEARKLQRVFEKHEDPSVFNVAQLAVGMNPEVREFTDRFLAAHGKYGNVHVGIGTSTGLLGGEVKAPVHFDGMMEEATLELDGEAILKDGSDFTLF